MFDHDQKELFEIDCLVLISVGVTHHCVQLLRCDRLAQGFHDVFELLSVDRLVSVLVEELKRLVKRIDLLGVELQVLKVRVVKLFRRHPLSLLLFCKWETKTN